MSIAIAQSRQQLSSLIALAQQQPQFITNRNKPVAVPVSADYFVRNQVAAQTDTLIAATAMEHQLVLATRNVRDVMGCGVQVVNPFDE